MFSFKFKNESNWNAFLLAGDKFMPEMYLKQSGFNYSACGIFTKNKERSEKFMQTRNANFIYKDKLNKACFNMIWLMLIQEIHQKELNQTKF